jgi:hypothetical protein
VGTNPASSSGDDEFRPVLHYDGKNRRNLDHPRNGSPEVAEELDQGMDFFLFDCIGAILSQPLPGFFPTETLAAGGKFLEKRFRSFLAGFFRTYSLCFRDQEAKERQSETPTYWRKPGGNSSLPPQEARQSIPFQGLNQFRPLWDRIF